MTRMNSSHVKEHVWLFNLHTITLLMFIIDDPCGNYKDNDNTKTKTKTITVTTQ